jgi:hypothetical protein
VHDWDMLERLEGTCSDREGCRKHIEVGWREVVTEWREGRAAAATQWVQWREGRHTGARQLLL